MFSWCEWVITLNIHDGWIELFALSVLLVILCQLIARSRMIEDLSGLVQNE